MLPATFIQIWSFWNFPSFPMFDIPPHPARWYHVRDLHVCTWFTCMRTAPVHLPKKVTKKPSVNHIGSSTSHQWKENHIVFIHNRIQYLKVWLGLLSKNQCALTTESNSKYRVNNYLFSQMKVTSKFKRVKDTAQTINVCGYSKEQIFLFATLHEVGFNKLVYRLIIVPLHGNL